jgi:hypothetical protein
MKFGVINLRYIYRKFLNSRFNLVTFKSLNKRLLLYKFLKLFFFAEYRKRLCESEKIHLEVLIFLHFSYPLPHYENAVSVCRLCVCLCVCIYMYIYVSMYIYFYVCTYACVPLYRLNSLTDLFIFNVQEFILPMMFFGESENTISQSRDPPNGPQNTK